MADVIAGILMGLAKLGIGTIATKLAAAYEAKQNATTRQAEIAADERIRVLEARRDVMAAEGHSPINAVMRAAFAVPPAIYLGKLFLWDKVLGWGATDPLSPMLEGVTLTVVGFYFLQWTVGTLKR